MSLEKLPILVERRKESRSSSYEDYSELDDFVNNCSSSDEEVEMVDAFAYFDMTNEDYRNLGKIHEGPRDTALPDCTKIKDSVLKVATYYSESNAKNAFKH